MTAYPCRFCFRSEGHNNARVAALASHGTQIDRGRLSQVPRRGYMRGGGWRYTLPVSEASLTQSQESTDDGRPKRLV
jgi:hypothetical protein